MKALDLTLYRGDTWTQNFTYLGTITGYAEVWLTAKRDKDESDTYADIKLSSLAGLEKINQTDPTAAANGTLTVNSAPLGDLTVTIKAVETAKLSVSHGPFYYDVQWKNAAGAVYTLQRGLLTVLGDVTLET